MDAPLRENKVSYDNDDKTLVKSKMNESKLSALRSRMSINIWLILAVALIIWFMLIHGPPQIENIKTSQPIGPWFGLHLGCMFVFVFIMMYNAAFPPTKGNSRVMHRVLGFIAWPTGTIFTYSNTYIHRYIHSVFININVGFMGFISGAVTSWWERADTVPFGGKIGLSIAGIIGTVGLIGGIIGIQWYKNAVTEEARIKYLRLHAGCMVGTLIGSVSYIC